MEMPLATQIAALYRYPVKGLSKQDLNSVTVSENACFPYDRAYAIENGPARFDRKDPKPLPKVNFLMLMRDERLALLDSSFAEEDLTLTISRDGRKVASGSLETSIGRNMLEQFFGAFMSEELKGAPRILSSKDHHFTDKPGPFVHIINLSSVTALERALNVEINPDRFRANIHLSGLEPWAEKKMIGKRLKINDAEIEIIEETERCAAVNVDPKTAKRDQRLPATLAQHFGSSHFGIYGLVKKAGTFSINDTVTIIGE